IGRLPQVRPTTSWWWGRRSVGRWYDATRTADGITVALWILGGSDIVGVLQRCVFVTDTVVLPRHVEITHGGYLPHLERRLHKSSPDVRCTSPPKGLSAWCRPHATGKCWSPVRGDGVGTQSHLARLAGQAPRPGTSSSSARARTTAIQAMRRTTTARITTTPGV